MEDHDEKGTAARAIIPVDARRLAPVVAQAMVRGGPLDDPATISALLDVQERWEANEARREYHEAMVSLKGDLPAVIGHDKEVKFNDVLYTHTTLAAAMAAVQGPLTTHGFALQWKPETCEKLVTVTCRLTHRGGHSEECSISSQPDNSGRKGPAQAVASTITYLSRYTALSLLGIATADMKEPHGPREEEPAKVDVNKNLGAAAWIEEQGGSVAEAERLVGRLVAEWTADDLGRIREWARAPSKGDADDSDFLPEGETS